VARSLRIDAAAAEGLLRDAAALGVVEAPLPLALAATAPALPPASPAPLGAVLNGTYELDAHLGHGAMGTVYAAHHLRTGRAYAVKMILPGGRAPADLARRFEREATAAGGLGHPHIVGVHDLDATPEGQCFLVMDLLRGETLEQRLAREGSLPFAEARRVALEIASALGAAHAAGLLHRDVKPANVFLAAAPGCAPRAVLLDFGLVKRLDEAATSRLTATGAVLGTPLYMAPEQARGEPLDPRSDLHALAALLFEMVTGAPPFLDRTLAAVYARLLHESAPRAGSICAVPPALDELLARGLARRREDRFPDAAAFAAALASIPP
jgi:serine/threonine-protein kinase